MSRDGKTVDVKVTLGIRKQSTLPDEDRGDRTERSQMPSGYPQTPFGDQPSWEDR